MAVRLDHTVIPARDGETAAKWFAHVFGFDRIRAKGVDYWADPGRQEVGAINRHDGGRGVYFPSPDDHRFEIITVPYSGVAKPG